MKYVVIKIQRNLVQFYKNTKFYLKNGFRRAEIWNLDTGIQEYILPRLKYFRKHHYSYPQNLTPEKWNEILDDIIFAMELDKYDYNNFEKNGIRAERGLKYLSEYFWDLWD